LHGNEVVDFFGIDAAGTAGAKRAGYTGILAAGLCAE
jgi:hypothetical protein